jgi:parallel beta-helix repeat protein
MASHFVWPNAGPRISTHRDWILEQIIAMGGTPGTCINVMTGNCYISIQDAIDNASDGDEIVVCPWTYYESIDFKGKAITVRSTRPYDWDVVSATIIDANGLDDAVVFTSGEDANSVLKGFTITGGSKRGINCDGGSPMIQNCSVTDNYIGVRCFSSEAEVLNNKIFGNTYIGIACGKELSVTVRNNLVFENGGPGITLSTDGITDTIENNTIVYNGDEGIRKGQGLATPKITNCIVWGNDGDYNVYSGFSPTYCCIEDWTGGGTGNITSDPQFVDPNDSDYHLRFDSPCINIADPCYAPEQGEMDIDIEPRVIGGRMDMGSDEVWRVHNITQDTLYWRVQDAIDEAIVKDRLEAWEDTYDEAIDFKGKGITLRGTNPQNWDVVAATIIDANGLDDTVTFDSGEDANSVLKGFTIIGGSSYGINCDGSSPIIERCIVRNNDGGIRIYGGSPTVSNNKIYNNTTNGGIQCRGNSTTSASAIIKNNLIYENYNGIMLFGSGNYNTSSIINNTVVDNPNLGICKGGAGDPSVTITNCIVWGNDGAYNVYSGFSPTYCCIEDWTGGGTGNITTDPNFVDAANDDYHLQRVSPCIDVGDPCYMSQDSVVDIDGDLRVMFGRIDIGADEVRRVHNITQDKWYVYIQEAIDEANSDDEIAALQDTYYETVDFKGKTITVRSVDPNDWDVVAATIIDANGLDDAVVFTSGEDANSVLKGFTTTGGSKRGINCDGGSPSIQNCSVTKNYIGVRCFSSEAEVLNNKIFGNTYIGIACGKELSVTVRNNLVFENDGPGITLSTDGITDMIENNTIVYNGDEGIRKGKGLATPKITNCIVWGNDGDYNVYSGFSPTYCCIGDWTGGGTGNITDDPLFVDPNDSDYHLRFDSPCINVGDPNYAPAEGETDIDGEPRVMGDRIDMGADEWPCLTPETAIDPLADPNDDNYNYYDEWIVAGAPKCWCYVSQCRGDCDGVISGSSKGGYYHVAADDFNLLVSAWDTTATPQGWVKEPPFGPGIATKGYNHPTKGWIPAMCANLDHSLDSDPNGGYYYVGDNDFNRLMMAWDSTVTPGFWVKEPTFNNPSHPHYPNGIPEDCGGDLGEKAP